jgi:muramoyltetrapeptide carboxypeptidase
MNRKFFLSLIPTSLILTATNGMAASISSGSNKRRLKIPPYLQQGDTIGITCPAGFITQEEIEPAILQFRKWGFNVEIGKTVGARDFTFGGTDQERLADLQQQLDNPAIKAIMCARGGYGAVRIIDQLDFSLFRKSPKWLIGFSDITILHCHINTIYRVATIHSKMCNSFPSDWALAEPIQIATINSIQQVLKGEKMKYQAAYNPNNRMGSANGELIGGNLRCIENLAGSDSEIETEGKILFVEDTGEYLYSIDRMFYNLKRSGKLAKLSGLIVGGFKVKTDDEGSDYGKNLEAIVFEKVSGFNYPVCFDFPVGHQRANFALKCGVNHRLDVRAEGSSLNELA